ncbi:unnamed protein product [Blepharisma stoltei]|uniref:DNA-(apurinic or apyrimidinic site) endonuclease n=1 Tax=Blepharisma stoltei TaxID=1481888 RepID=A0AAU9K8G8_9CILI|nr:unnamed protein product [Blepharisma stoltei]
MNIVSLNCNGLHSYSSKFPSFEDMLDSFNADIICLQKIKLAREKLQPELINLNRYYAFYQFSQSKTANGGVATFCKKDTACPVFAKEGFLQPENNNHDLEGRCLVTDHQEFVLFNVYFPTNGNGERIPFKSWFFYIIQYEMEKLVSGGKNVILATDLSFSHHEIDHYDPDSTLAEMGLDSFNEHRGRQWLTILLSSDRFFDAYRLLYTNQKGYTYYKTPEMKAENKGCRLDYFIVSKKIADQYVEDLKILPHKIPSLPSDQVIGHCPIKLTLSSYHSAIPSEPPTSCAKFYNEFSFEKHRSLNMYFQGEEAKEICKKVKRSGVEPENTKNNEKFNKKFEMDGVELCTHGEPAIVQEVKKEGKNKGRPFFTCARPPGHPRDPEARCGFFKWADESKSAPVCEHDMPAVVRRVQKEGANHGKWYYRCRKNMKQGQCGFFKWADALNNQMRNDKKRQEPKDE